MDTPYTTLQIAAIVCGILAGLGLTVAFVVVMAGSLIRDLAPSMPLPMPYMGTSAWAAMSEADRKKVMRQLVENGIARLSGGPLPNPKADYDFGRGAYRRPTIELAELICIANTLPATA